MYKNNHSPGFWIISVIFCLFTILNYDSETGLVLLCLTVAGSMIDKTLKDRGIPTYPVYESSESKTIFSFIKSSEIRFFAIPAFLYMIFVFVMYVFNSMNIFEPASLTASLSSFSIFYALKEPAMHGNVLMFIFIQAIVIPQIETIVISGKLREYLAVKMHVVLYDGAFGFDNIKINLIIGAFAVLFHLTVKGITNNFSLFMVFCFFAFLGVIIDHFKTYQHANLIHTIANFIAALILYGVIH